MPAFSILYKCTRCGKNSIREDYCANCFSVMKKRAEKGAKLCAECGKVLRTKYKEHMDKCISCYGIATYTRIVYGLKNN